MSELNEQIADALRDLGLAVKIPPRSYGDGPDLVVTLPTAHGDTRSAVEVKQRGAMTTVDLEKWRSRYPNGAILGSDYVTRAQARRLQAAGIDYIDAVGNAHISRPGLRIHVEGRLPDRSALPTKVGQLPLVLGPASLRIVFTLLIKPTLVSATFDDLAELAGVSKGTVHNAMNDLVERGHLTGTRRDRHMVDIPKLTEIWVDGFATQLLPRLATTVLAGPDPQWWAKPSHRHQDITIGGGPALTHYGGSLRPDRTIVYGPEPWRAARKLGRLTTHGQQNIILRERFWSPNLIPDTQFVHPLLAYADALAGGDSREIEVARDLRKRGLVGL